MYDELDKLSTFFPGIEWPEIQKVLREGFVLNPEDWAYIRSAIELAESGRATDIDMRGDLLKAAHTFRIKYTSSPLKLEKTMTKIERACLAWVNRDSLTGNKSEFLINWYKRTDQLFSEHQLRRALTKAAKRGLIEKGDNGRWREKTSP